MRRIVIIGSGGAGKSTLARQLGALLGIEVIHLDTLYWRPDWVPTPEDVWRALVQQVVEEREEWIIDGNYNGTLDIRFAAADTIVFLDFPRRICLWRVLKRVLTTYGRTRPDMAPGCPEKLDFAFLRWIWGYPKASRASVLQQIERYADSKRVMILRRPTEVRQFLEGVGLSRESVSGIG